MGTYILMEQVMTKEEAIEKGFEIVKKELEDSGGLSVKDRLIIESESFKNNVMQLKEVNERMSALYKPKMIFQADSNSKANKFANEMSVKEGSKFIVRSIKKASNNDIMIAMINKSIEPTLIESEHARSLTEKERHQILTDVSSQFDKQQAQR